MRRTLFLTAIVTVQLLFPQSTKMSQSALRQALEEKYGYGNIRTIQEVEGRNHTGVVIATKGNGSDKELYLDITPCEGDKKIATFQWRYTEESASSITCDSKTYPQKSITQQERAIGR